MAEMRIGDLARAARTRTATIRYYESIGLLPEPERRGGNQRVYGPQDLARLRFILRCRALGFTLEDLRALVEIARSQTSSGGACRNIVQRRLASVRDQLRRLRDVEARLVELLNEGASAPPEWSCDRLAALA